MMLEIFTHHIEGFNHTLAAHCPQYIEGQKFNDNDWDNYLQVKIAMDDLSSAEHDSTIS